MAAGVIDCSHNRRIGLSVFSNWTM